MNRSILGRLVLKDLYLYRWMIGVALMLGIGSLVLSETGSGDGVRTGPNLGTILFMTTIIAFGAFVAMWGVLKERQDKFQLFVLSLPVSAAQYSVAKVVAALIAFLVPWLVLVLGAVLTTVLSGRPQGGLPFYLVMMTFFLGNFCVLLALIVITMSEVWSIAGLLITNVSVPVFLMQVSSLPGVADRSGQPEALWSPALLIVLGVEIALILLSLALAFLIPSRKKDYL